NTTQRACAGPRCHRCRRRATAWVGSRSAARSMLSAAVRARAIVTPTSLRSTTPESSDPVGGNPIGPDEDDAVGYGNRGVLATNRELAWCRAPQQLERGAVDRIQHRVRNRWVEQRGYALGILVEHPNDRVIGSSAGHER